MSLVADLDALIATLPPDWEYVEAVVELEDPVVFTQTNLVLARVNAGRPVGAPQGTYRLRINRVGGHGAALPAVRGAFAVLDRDGATCTLTPAFAWSSRTYAQP